MQFYFLIEVQKIIV